MKSQKPGGLYRGVVNDEEAQALMNWNWPTEVSSQALPLNLMGKTIIDIGAGPNRNLGDMVIHTRHGRYVAIDVNEAFVATQRALGREACRGSIMELRACLTLPINREEVITHTRLVLMHLPPEDRSRAIRELAAIGSTGYVLDTNWSNFIESASHEPLRTFIAITLGFARAHSIDLRHGGKLKKLATETLGESYTITEKIYSQGVGNYYGEIIDLARREIGAFTQEGERNKVEELLKLIEIFEKLRQKNDPQDHFESPHVFHVVSFSDV